MRLGWVRRSTLPPTSAARRRIDSSPWPAIRRRAGALPVVDHSRPAGRRSARLSRTSQCSAAECRTTFVSDSATMRNAASSTPGRQVGQRTSVRARRPVRRPRPCRVTTPCRAPHRRGRAGPGRRDAGRRAPAGSPGPRRPPRPACARAARGTAVGVARPGPWRPPRARGDAGQRRPEAVVQVAAQPVPLGEGGRGDPARVHARGPRSAAGERTTTARCGASAVDQPCVPARSPAARRGAARRQRSPSDSPPCRSGDARSVAPLGSPTLGDQSPVGVPDGGVRRARPPRRPPPASTAHRVLRARPPDRRRPGPRAASGSARSPEHEAGRPARRSRPATGITRHGHHRRGRPAGAAGPPAASRASAVVRPPMTQGDQQRQRDVQQGAPETSSMPSSR